MRDSVSTSRTNAIRWFNLLRITKKVCFVNEAITEGIIIGEVRSPSSLSGREIELLFTFKMSQDA